jgi:transcriptional regulator with XRE-family HTH domain
MISVALFHHIRQLYEREGLSQRQIAKKLGISRNTVAKYLKQEAVLPTAIERKQIYNTNIILKKRKE